MHGFTGVSCTFPHFYHNFFKRIQVGVKNTASSAARMQFAWTEGIATNPQARSSTSNRFGHPSFSPRKVCASFLLISVSNSELKRYGSFLSPYSLSVEALVGLHVLALEELGGWFSDEEEQGKEVDSVEVSGTTVVQDVGGCDSDEEEQGKGVDSVVVVTVADREDLFLDISRQQKRACWWMQIVRVFSCFPLATYPLHSFPVHLKTT